MTLKENILLCLITLTSISVFGQAEITEKSLWSNVHITKELSSNLSAKVKVSYYSTMPLFSPRFIDMGLNYKLENNLSFGLYYRFKGAFDASCHRFYFETTYKNIKIKPLGLELTPRFRVQHKLVENNENLIIRSLQFRPKLLIKKSFTASTSLYSSTETFYSGIITDKKLDFNRLRFDFGLSYKVPNSKHQIKFYYRYQMDNCGAEIETLSVLNIGYRFSFASNRKKLNS